MEIRIFDNEIDGWKTLVITREVCILNGNRRLYVKEDLEQGYMITAFNDGYPMSITPMKENQIRIS